MGKKLNGNEINGKFLTNYSNTHINEIINSVNNIIEKETHRSPYDVIDRIFAGLLEEMRKNEIKEYWNLKNDLTNKEHVFLTGRDKSGFTKNRDIKQMKLPYDSWADHLRSYTYQGHRVLVAEPYGLSEEGVKDLIKRCELFGTTFSIDARNAYHFVGRTVGIFIPIP